MINGNFKHNLDRPVTYQIKMPGEFDESWTDWAEGMLIAASPKGDYPPTITMTGKLDQAALHGLLRRLYSLGVPLISVICLDVDR